MTVKTQSMLTLPKTNVPSQETLSPGKKIVKIYLRAQVFWGHVVGNNTKSRISKWVLQENKACQIFPKTNISYRRNQVYFTASLFTA